MARARLILDTRKASQSSITGLFPIAVRVFNIKPRIIRLSHYTSIKGWDETNLLLRKSVKENIGLDCDDINIEIYDKLDAAKRVINEIGESINNIHVDTLVEEIKDRWEGKNKSNLKKKHEKCITLSEFGQVLIDRKNKSNKPATAKWYKDSIDAFKDVNGGKDLTLNEVTVKFLKTFEAEHRSRNNSTNTISAYMRGVSSVYNAAISEDEFKTEKNPFKHYKIPRTKRTKKKALPKENIADFKKISYEFESPIWHTKNYMMVMFFGRGMNLIDLAKLQVKDIYSGYLFYGRSKTDDPLSVKVTNELQVILDYYLINKEPHDFVFPIGNDGSVQMFKKYRSDRRLVNKHLKIIAQDAGLDCKLTTYYLRHSWATIAKFLGLPVSLISDALGHQSVATTEGYLKSFVDDKLDEANELVIA
ncbi:site-specific integrase [Maribacter sp. SA7]|uniref:tyrosine-type recombinase/integrase n=1 Tax=Maribacter zhoushanensis TaxID=3030012 RepID=UPI0023ED56B7|nr:site-specific integrase [Maribacter zhoushanensis]MDF4203827.1 site-specific integrase [Maribacter zhoushanensis]